MQGLKILRQAQRGCLVKPKISFVIPTYDGDSYLAETLESIRNQSLKDIEIIVIDDCSPDFTPELMEWYMAKDERIKYHRLEVNGGVEEARNYGNKLAEADLICVSDHDDLSTKHRALYSYHWMKRYPEIDCLTSGYWELDDDGNQMKLWPHPNVITKQTLLDGTYLDSGGWLHSSACYKKEDILKLTYRRTDGRTDDYILLIDWLDAGKTFFSTRKILANKRMGINRQMNKLRLARGEQPIYYR